MALEAVVYQQQENFGYGCTKSFSFLSPNNGVISCFDYQEDRKPLLRDIQLHSVKPPGEAARRRKRRREKTEKNEMEIVGQRKRMTHIEVERNRRKLMNEYLAALRSLMPPSYVARGDQASIIGGAINFVKELEQHLSFMEAHQHERSSTQQLPFANFFNSPQFSLGNRSPTPSIANDRPMPAADIEVSMVESHANLKIVVKKQHRQVLKLVAGLQALRLNILYLNVSTLDQLILYSLSVKTEEDCHLNTVDDIAAAINQMLRRIQEEAA